VVAVDFDNDGDTDLLTLGDGGIITPTPDSPIQLYVNNGDGTFTDVLSSSGIDAPDSHVTAAVADTDNDGDLDLFIGAPGNLATTMQHASKFYRNDGNMRFTDITDLSGITANLGACVSGFSDYDNDGDQDLFVGNCNDVIFRPTPIQLFRNDGDSQFIDVTIEAGLDLPGNWMSISFGDFNNDGWVDLFSSNVGQWLDLINFDPNKPRNQALLINQRNGTFIDVGAQAGVGLLEFGWGASVSDFNNDGWLDIFYAGNFPLGNLFSRPQFLNPGHMLINSRQGKNLLFIDSPESLPIDLTFSVTVGVGAADYDNDGNMDIAAVREAVVESGDALLFKNQGLANGWLQVSLEGTISNRDAVGARVTTLGFNARRQVREVYGSSSYSSSETKILHFGFGDSGDANELQGIVRVDWPSGGVEWSQIAGINRRVHLVEGTGNKRLHDKDEAGGHRG